MANTIASYGRFREGKLSPRKVLANSVIAGGIVVALNYIYMGFFTPGLITPELTSIGLLPGLIRTGQMILGTPERMLFCTALMMIGWSVLFSGVFLYLLMRKGGVDKPRRNFLVLGICATTCVVIYPVLQDLLRPFMTNPLTPENFLGALIISWLVGPSFPIFPYLGFALFGVIFGLLVVDKATKRTLLVYGYGIGAIFTVIGFICIALVGFTANAFDTPDLQVLLAVLGNVMLALTFIMHVMDFAGDKVKVWWIRHSRRVRSCGLISLSAFFLEASLAVAVRHIFEIFYPAFTYDFLFMFAIFAPIMAIIWIVVVRLWARVHFKASFEWMIDRLMAKFTGKQTDRLNTDYILRSSDAYLDRPAGSQ